MLIAADAGERVNIFHLHALFSKGIYRSNGKAKYLLLMAISRIQSRDYICFLWKYYRKCECVHVQVPFPSQLVSTMAMGQSGYLMSSALELRPDSLPVPTLGLEITHAHIPKMLECGVPPVRHKEA